MLVRKSMPPQCATCERASKISDTEMVCVRHGVVGSSYHCRSYRYDPLKRIPERKPPLRIFKEEHFKLD